MHSGRTIDSQKMSENEFLEKKVLDSEFTLRADHPIRLTLPFTSSMVVLYIFLKERRGSPGMVHFTSLYTGLSRG